MQFTNEFYFPQDVDTIYKSYINKKFLTQKMEALGARNIEITITNNKEQVIIETSREMQAEVPAPIKKFFAPWNQITQKEVWQGDNGGPYYAEMEMEINGVPASITGQIKLSSSEEGSMIANNTEINSKIPFLGNTISKFISEASEEAIQNEFEYVKENA